MENESVTDASIERETLTWDGFGSATRDLAPSILDSGFEPEVVVAIARGGLLPAGAIAYGLGAKNCGAINVEFYTGIGTVLDAPEVLPPALDMDYLDGRRVLLVDDVADHHPTGLRLEGHGPVDQLPVVVPGHGARGGPGPPADGVTLHGLGSAWVT